MKKGFTLIELLAVIVILAVIALIAVPIILNVIETSKQGAIKDSAYGVIESAEMYLAKNMKNGVESTMTFTCSNNKCVSDNIEISYKGKVESGTLLLTPSGKTVVCVDDGENYAYKLEDEQKVSSGYGTCGEYVEANGEFKILSDVDSLKAEIASLKQQVTDSYQEGYDAGHEIGMTESTRTLNDVKIQLWTGSYSTHTIDLNPLVTEGKISDCTTLTVDNFITEVTYGTGYACLGITKSYNQSTCILTVTKGNNTNNGSEGSIWLIAP